MRKLYPSLKASSALVLSLMLWVPATGVVAETDMRGMEPRFLGSPEQPNNGDNLGNHVAEQNIDLAGFRITGLSDPSEQSDAVNVRFLQSAITAMRDNLGNHIATMTLNMSDNEIFNLSDPSTPSSAVNLRTLNDAVLTARDNLGNHIATQALDMMNFRVLNVADPVSQLDAVNLKTLRTEIDAAPGDNLGNHIAAMDLNLADFRIRNLNDPEGPMDSVNLRTLQGAVEDVLGEIPDPLTPGSGISIDGTVISVDATVVRTTGNQTIGGNKTFTGVTNFSGQRVTNVADPSNGTDAANMRWVQNQISTSISEIPPYTGGTGITVAGTVISFDQSWGDGRYALRSRTITAGDGLSGGGNLQSNRTLAVDGTVVRTSGNQTIGGNKTFTGVSNFSGQRIVNIADPTEDMDAVNRRWALAQIASLPPAPIYTGGVGITVSGTVINFDTVWGDNRYVLNSRQIVAGTGLAGGGDLSANRSISFDQTWGDARYALRSRTISAGDGLSGGGSLASNRTLTVDGTVIRNFGDQLIDGVKTFADNISMAENRIINLADPASALDAVNLRTMSAAIAAAMPAPIVGGDGITVAGSTVSVNNTVVRTTGNQSIGGNKTFTGVANFSNQRVTAVADPTAATDAANRRWVEAQIAAVAGTIPTYTGGTGISVAGTVISFDQSWGDGRYALRSRQIIAGDGLSGGGNLQSNRTIAVDGTVVRTSGDQSIAGIKTFTGSLRSSMITDEGGTNRTGTLILPGVTASGGNRTGTIETAALTSNRVWTFPNTTGTIVLESRTLTAGDGLSGGGTLQSNRTFSVDATVVRTTGNQSIAGNKTFTGVTSFSNQRVTAVADPTAATDAANRRWVEAQIAAVAGTIPTYTGGTGITVAGTVISFDQSWGDGRYALRSRQIIAGDGLSGGGNLQSNRTIAVDGTVVRTSGDQSIAGTKTFTGRLQSARTVDGFTGTIRLEGAIASGSDRRGTIATEPLTANRTWTFPNATGTIVLESRTLTAGDGLSGGGTLQGNRTFSVDATVVRTTGNQSIAGNKTFTGVTSFSNQRVTAVADPTSATDAANRRWVEAQIAAVAGTIPTYTGGTGITVAGTVISFDQSWGDGRYALRSRTITAGTGLTGGGNLQSNRTLSFDATWGDNRYVQRSLTLTAGTGLTGGGDLQANRSLAFDTTWGDARYALRSRTITAGDGLSGGGSLASNRTISVDGTVVRTSGNQTISGEKTFTEILNMSNQRIAMVSDPAEGQDAVNLRTMTAAIDAITGGSGPIQPVAAGDGISVSGSVVSVNATVVRTSGNQTIGGNKTFTGVTSFSNQRVTAVADPTNATDAANRRWVEAQIAAVAGTIPTYTGGTGITVAGTVISFDQSWGDGRYALRSRQIIAGDGLTGGGNLQSNRTLAVDGTVVRTSGAQIIAGLKTFMEADGTRFQRTTGQDGILLQGRAAGTGNFAVTITPGALTANRTLTLANGNTTLVAGTMVPDSRTFTAGDGLSGGGTLQSNRTFSVDATVVRTTGNQSIAGNKTFTGVTSFSNQRVTAVADPTSATDAANRRWVEAQIAAVAGTIPTYTGGTGITVAGTVISFDQSWGDGRYALRSRQIIAGDGLSGGGNLQSNRTIAVDGTVVRTSGDQSIAGIKTFTGSLRSSMITNEGGTNRTGTLILPGVTASGGNRTGTIETAALTANRVWTLPNAAGTIVLESRTLTAGDGLSGGGSLQSNRTFSVDATVVRTTGNQSIAGNKTFTGVTSFSNQRVTAVADPTNATDAANRRWVEAQIAAVAGTIPTYTGGTGITVAGTVISFDQSWGDGRYALRSRQIIAGDGLSGGGNLQSNRTIAVDGTVVRTFGSQTISGNKSFTGSNTFAVGNVGDRNFMITRGATEFNFHLGHHELHIESTAAPSTYSGFGISQDGHVGIGRRPDDSWRLRVNGDARIDGSAYVGSSSDLVTDYKLVTVESRGFAGLQLLGDTGNVSGEPGGAFVLLAQDGGHLNSGTSGVKSILGIVNRANEDGSGNEFIGTRSNSTVLGTIGGSYDLHLGTNNNVNMTIRSSGNVGIGTNSPTEMLHVDGKIRIGEQATAPTDAVRADRILTAGDGLSGGGNLTANRTIAVDGTVVRTTGNQSIAGNKTFTGIANFSNQRVTAVADPTTATDAANRRWVEAQISALSGDIPVYTGGTGISVSGTVINFDQSWGDGRYALRSRTITAGTGLTGGGNLQSNRTINFDTTWGDSRYVQRSLTLTAGTGLTGGGNLQANRSLAFDTTWGDARYALRSRTITAGDGLSGGGNLQSNRTIAVDGTVVRTSGDQTIAGLKTFMDADGTRFQRAAGQDGILLRGRTAGTGNFAVTITPGTLTANRTLTLANGNTTLVAGTMVPDSRSIAAGDGLTGGGNLQSNRTLAVDGTVVRTSGNQTIGGNKTFTGVTSFSNQRVTAVADPTNATDAANRRWVEAQIAAVAGTIPTYTGGTGITVAGTVISFDQSWGDGRYALRSRQIIAGDGLSGGGNLQSNRTIAVDGTVVRTTGSQSIAGNKTFTGRLQSARTVDGFTGTIRLEGAIASGSDRRGTIETEPLTANRTWTFPNASGTVVLDTRTITAGTGLTGGGNLQSNRTINFDQSWGDARYALRSRTITAGDGLSGGGNLQSNRTIAVDGTVVRTSGDQSIAGIKTFTGSLRSSMITNEGGTNRTGTLILPGVVASGGNRSGTLATAALSGNRTWTLPNATGTIVLETRTITAGTGLNGGGSLQANRTISLDANQIRRNAGQTDQGVMAFNGTARATGQFYGGTTNPSHNTRLNYSGHFYATQFYSTAYFHFSDESLKERIEDLQREEFSDRLMRLRPVSYDWIETGDRSMGLIAQEVQKVYPDLVRDTGDGTLSVDYVQLISPMLAKIQELSGDVEAERARNAELTSIIGDMEERLMAIEALLRD